MAVDIVNDRRDNTVFPLRGSYRHLYIETGFPGFRIQRRYGLLSPEYVGYYPLRRRIVSASRVSVGVAGPMRTDDILPNKRYFAGGAGSVRGFERHMLGPLDQDGNAIGGIARLEASTELRFRLIGILYGAAFFDAGNVWDTRGSIGFHGLGYAAGPGLLARSPIGPIRLDVGFRLSPGHPSQPRVVPSISVGATF
jgi:outer membrane protein insertion porin family